MSKTATTTISISIVGDGTTQNTAVSDPANTSAPSPGSVTLSNGFTAITIPGSPYTVQSLTIIPPAGSTVTKTLKGVTGDTGIVLSTTLASKIPVGSGASIGIAANGAEVCQLVWG